MVLNGVTFTELSIFRVPSSLNDIARGHRFSLFFIFICFIETSIVITMQVQEPKSITSQSQPSMSPSALYSLH